METTTQFKRILGGLIFLFILFLCQRCPRVLSLPLSEKTCLTWSLDNKGKLTLVCRLTNLDHDVHIYGNDGTEKGHCLFETAKIECFLTNETSSIAVDKNDKTVIYSEYFDDVSKVDGVWYCRQNEIRTSTVVSINSGIRVASEITLEGTFADESHQQVILSCWSCREPIFSSAEFLLNDQSIHTLSYFSHKCYSGIDVECKPSHCNCSDSVFTLAFQIPRHTIDGNFSCHMRFNDRHWSLEKSTSIYFSTEAVNSGFHKFISKTNVINHSFGRYNIKDETRTEKPRTVTDNEEARHDTLIGVIVLSAVVVVGIIIIAFPYLRNHIKQCKCQIEGHHTNDQVCLMEGQTSTHKCKTCGTKNATNWCRDCKMFYCAKCGDSHSNKRTNHVIVNFETNPSEIYNNKSPSCDICKHCKGSAFCARCEHIVCSMCACSHKPTKIISRISRDNTTDNASELSLEYSMDLVEQTNLEVKIYVRGIAFLEDERIIIADSENERLIIYKKGLYQFQYKLDFEPRGLTAMEKNTVAITCGYKMDIQILEILSKDIQHVKTVNLQNNLKLGKLKTFYISYNQRHLAVEAGETINGKIVILKDDLTLYKVINAENNSMFFTGNTIRLALDMSKKVIYVSAMSKNAVVCIGFDGKEKWSMKLHSPRDIVCIPCKTKYGKNVIAVSKLCSAILRLDEENGHSTILTSKGDINLPRYIGYNHKENLICIEVENEESEENEKRQQEEIEKTRKRITSLHVFRYSDSVSD